MEPVKITDKVYWVGAYDPNMKYFHGYQTTQGSTYNAFLIMDKKITLIDTTKKEFLHELVSRITKIIPMEKIDQVISNHSELDHAGCLPEVMDMVGSHKPLYASVIGAKTLKAHFRDSNMNIIPVNAGESVSMGDMELQFVETRMIHWPDSMFSFCPQNGILFSQDAFGMHLATTERFDDQVCQSVWEYQAKSYFANILSPYTGQIAKLLEQLDASGLTSKVKMIAPDHGFIWRSAPEKIIDYYKRMVLHKSFRKAVIIFDSMWHSTEFMAHYLADALRVENVDVKLMSMKSFHRSVIATECYDAGAIIVGSPTLNNEMYPSIQEVLNYLKGLKFQNKLAFAFGSYGWSGEAVKRIDEEFVKMKYNVPCENFKFQWVPRESDLTQLKQNAKVIADLLPTEPAPMVCHY